MEYLIILNICLFMLKIWISHGSDEQDNLCSGDQICAYQCRCEGKCRQDDGKCPEKARCDKGWFGPRCQYQDLANSLGATFKTNPFNADIGWLTDGNDSTCNTNNTLDSIEVKWTDTSSIPLTWTRIVVSDPESLSRIHLQFIQENSKNMKSCLNETYSLQAQETMDIRCNDNVKITILNVVGNLTSLCSFYISGGRNIAYKQKAVQTSTYESVYSRYNASQAVDGKRLSDVAMCARTNLERSPSLNISLQSVYVIQRFIVEGSAAVSFENNYTPKSNLDNRYLSNVRLVIRTFDIDKNVVGVSKAVTNPFGQVYNVTLNGSVSQPVTLISLSLQGEESSLILYEVQSFGECPAGYWSLPCSKPCPPSCPKTCDRDTGVCNTVCNGYSNPPQCGTECSNDSWGINCSHKCSEKCHDIKCNSRTGECYKGCKPGYQLPDCTKVCQSGQWGRNCTSSCNFNCFDSDCDSQRGSCLFGCIEGYRLPHCTETCVNGTYGQSCSSRCSSSCENAECDPFKGSCYKCAVGYEGPSCELKTFSVEMNSLRIGYAIGTLVTFLIILALLLVKPYLVQWREKFEKPSIYDQADALYEARHNYNDTVEEDNYQDREDIYQNCVVIQPEVDQGTEEYQNLSEYEFVKPK